MHQNLFHRSLQSSPSGTDLSKRSCWSSSNCICLNDLCTQSSSWWAAALITRCLNNGIDVSRIPSISLTERWQFFFYPALLSWQRLSFKSSNLEKANCCKIVQWSSDYLPLSSTLKDKCNFFYKHSDQEFIAISWHVKLLFWKSRQCICFLHTISRRRRGTLNIICICLLYHPITLPYYMEVNSPVYWVIFGMVTNEQPNNRWS